jgi:hypothetical protein
MKSRCSTRTDILLSLNLGGRGISPIHGAMSVLLAVEIGVSVVRVAGSGLSDHR